MRTLADELTRTAGLEINAPKFGRTNGVILIGLAVALGAVAYGTMLLSFIYECCHGIWICCPLVR